MEANTIFVQMAAYRDPELIPSIKDMITNAKNPENLHICVNWQHGDESEIDIFLDAGFEAQGFEEVEDKPYPKILMTHPSDAKLTVLDVNMHDAQGACWARNQIQIAYTGEKYTLQLDSHHRFVPDWDKVAIDMLESLRSEDVPKPLLTAYIPSYDPENDPAGRVQQAWKMDFDRFIPEGAVFFRPSTIDGWEDYEAPVPARFFSGHFTFADGSFAQEVQHDPDYFFHGEEISIAVRAFTHGYDMFHPHRIIAWHEYTRKGRTKIWDDHTTDVKNKGSIKLDWVERNNECHRRNRILFSMDGEDSSQIDFGTFGFGTVRTVRQYEEFAGISFEHRGVQQATLDRDAPPNNFSYDNEEEWKASFARSNDVHVCLHRGEFKGPDGTVPEDYDFFYVGCHDENGDEVYRKDLVKDQIYNYINGGNEFVDYRLIFLSVKKPVNFTVWPHSVEQGWMEKIVKPLDY